MHDVEPDADAVRLVSRWSSPDASELVSVEADLNDVVEEGEQRREREGCHKERHKSVLGN